MYLHPYLRSGLYSLLCILMCSCSLTPRELTTADRLMETAPDSALHILQHASASNYTSQSTRALYGLLMIQALNQNLLPLKPDSLLDFSIDYYQKHPDKDRLGACYLYKGRSCKARLQYEKAVEFYMKALDELQGSKNLILLGRINFDLGDINILQNDYALAREKYTMAYGYFMRAKLNAQAFYSRLNIGRTYHQAKDYKSAQRYYRKLVTLPEDSLQQGALLQEIALNYYDDKRLDSALVYYRRLIHYPYMGNNMSIRYNYLANVFFDLNNVDSAYIYAKAALEFEPGIRTQRECYRILTNTEYLKGNMKEMSSYMNHYVRLGDSLRRIDAQTKGSILENIHNTNLEVEKTRNKVWYLLGCLVLVMLGGFLLYSRLHRRTKIEKIHLETQKIQTREIHKKQIETEKIRMQAEKMHTEETHSKQKAGIRAEIMLKHGDALLEKMEALKAEQSSERKKATLAQRELLDRKIYDKLLHFNDINFFYRQMDTVLNNLVSKLKKRYPSLSDKEICWCCLFLLKVPTTDIYMLLHYQVGSLKKMRQRLAQKLVLSGAPALNDFLIGMLSE